MREPPSFDAGAGTDVDAVCHSGWQWARQLNSKVDLPTKGWDKLPSSSSVVIEGGVLRKRIPKKNGEEDDDDDDDDEPLGVPSCGSGRGEILGRRYLGIGFHMEKILEMKVIILWHQGELVGQLSCSEEPDKAALDPPSRKGNGKRSPT
eukprot:390476-Amphidinium_carterae.1